VFLPQVLTFSFIIFIITKLGNMSSVGIDLKELEGSAAKMFEILPRD